MLFAGVAVFALSISSFRSFSSVNFFCCSNILFYIFIFMNLSFPCYIDNSFHLHVGITFSYSNKKNISRYNRLRQCINLYFLPFGFSIQCRSISPKEQNSIAVLLITRGEYFFNRSSEAMTPYTLATVSSLVARSIGT